MQVVRLRHREAVRLDGACLQAIFDKHGLDHGELVICAAMEDIAGLLSETQACWKAGDIGGLTRHVKSLERIATKTGMPVLAWVARDTLSACKGRETAALAAVVARLMRIGQGSLLAVWEVEHAMI